MSVAQPDIIALRAWWSPAQLWRQFIAAVAVAASCFLLCYCLIKIGFSPSSFRTAVIVKDAALLMAFGGAAIASFLTFDACWLAGLFGATWKEILLLPLQRRFWRFAFAWVMIDLLFLSALSSLQNGAVAVQVDPAFKFSPGNFVISTGILTISLTLLWIRWRFIFWPIHTLVTGSLLDLEAPWQMTGRKLGSLFDLSMGLGVVCIVMLMIPYAFVVAMAPLQAFAAIPFAILAIATVFRTLQLAAFAERYRTANEDRSID